MKKTIASILFALVALTGCQSGASVCDEQPNPAKAQVCREG